ncbi:MAG: hypothetical protein ACR2MY_03630 [Candidatus Dormibacteria bacterium]
MPADHQDKPRRERRKEPRLPEELLAVMTDSAVAAKLIGEMPDDEKQESAEWVAEGEGRADRARRAVEVVRSAIAPKRGTRTKSKS